jgi:apolipoprotein N-acyltransferase
MTSLQSNVLAQAHLLRYFRRRWPGNLVSALAGTLITLSLAPFDFWPAGIAGLLLLQRLLNFTDAKQSAQRGWWFGAGLFLSGASWLYVSIHDFGAASVPLAAFLTGGFCLLLALMHALLGYGYARWIREAPGGRWLGFAASWVLWEWVRAWLLTGFPWLYTGYAHLATPLAGWAPLLGTLGISFIVALSAAALTLVLQNIRNVVPLVLSAALWLGGFALQHLNWSEPNGQRASVALIQADIPQSMKWDPQQFRDTLDTYSRMSAPYWQLADIVIWPEAAIPAFYDRTQVFFDEEAGRALQFHHALIAGVPYRTAPSAELPDGGIYNSALALGNGSGVYHKQHLVPFGEFVPFESALRGLIQFFNLPMSDFQAGPAGQEPLRAGALTFAPSICYEVVYGDLVRHSRADVLLTLSNDAWFGHSIGPLQHLQMAQMRALELGRYMVRATGNGVTAIIDNQGHITTRIPQFERGVLVGEVLGFSGLTPFARFGSWPILALCFAVLGAGLVARRRVPAQADTEN